MSGVNGLLQGIQAGNMLVDAYYRGQENKERSEIKNVMAEGLEGAKAQRQSMIDANVKVGSEANADNTMTMPTFADAKGNKFGSEAEARAAAEKNVPSIDDFYVKNVVPRIAETYLKQGNIEQAEKWNSWAEQKSTREGMKHWTKALQAGQMGDFKTYADSMVKAYNAPGYYDDGLEADGYELVKDKEGNTTGLTLNLRNKSTGEKFSQTVRGQEDMVRMGIGLLDPANAFKTTQAAVTAAQAARAKSAESDLKFKRDVYRDDRKGERQAQQQSQRDESAMDRLVTGKQIDAANKTAAVDAKANALRKAGYSDDFVKQAMPQLLGLGDYKKAAPPEEVRRMLHQARLSDFNYTRKTPEEQAAIINQDLQLINGAGSNPMASGIPSQGQQKAPAGGGQPMIFDRKTGQMIPYKR
jgi:hypothetical protein